jgi:hypothetical protein
MSLLTNELKEMSFSASLLPPLWALMALIIGTNVGATLQLTL